MKMSHLEFSRVYLSWSSSYKNIEENVRYYICKLTYGQYYNSSDINECEYENLCAPVGGKCVNEQGRYRCECIKGYKGDGKTCEGKRLDKYRLLHVKSLISFLFTSF